MSTSPASPSSETWARVGDGDFVQLTTFRRTGEGVPTPVWVARDGDTLLVTTPAGSGKVKRLGHTARVELRPCSRRGVVPEGAPTLAGSTVVDSAPDAHAKVEHLFAAKYGIQYKVVMLIETAIRTAKRSTGTARRIIRITPA